MNVTEKGGVYIAIYPGSRLTYKIGKSNSIKSRFSTLNTSVIGNYKLRSVIYPTDDNKYNSGMLLYIEQSLHRILDKYRIKKDKEFFKIQEINTVLTEAVNQFALFNFDVSITVDENDLQHVNEVRTEISEDINYNDTFDASDSKSLSSRYAPARLKPHQENIFKKLCEVFKSASDTKKGILVLPPGYGKSYITGFLIRELSYKRVLVLVPSDKIRQDFKKALHITNMSRNVIMLDDRNLILRNDEIYITTYQFYLSNKIKINKCVFDMVIYDEAHHLVDGIQWVACLELNTINKLFLTATPKMIELDENADEKKCCSMSNRELYGEIIHQETIEECIIKGLLCNYKLYVCGHKDNLVSICEELIGTHHRKRLILFFNTTAVASGTTAQINNYIAEEKLNWVVCHIYSGTPDDERQKIYDAFDKADDIPKIICNVNIIAEGANLVLTDTIIFAEKRNSSIGIIQNIGRALRTHPTKDFAMIVMPPSMEDTNTIIRALQLQDTRVTKKEMLIGNTIKNSELIDTIRKKCILIEKRFRIMTLPDFIQRLRLDGVHCESDYREKYAPAFIEPFIDDITATYPNFNWNNVLADIAYYTLDEAKQAIVNMLSSDGALIDDIRKIVVTNKKYDALRARDNRLPPDPLAYYTLKKYSELNAILKDITYSL
jgi:superfamily II DNA or RNA helicase